MAARVLLTRPRADSERVAARVSDLGFSPVIAPVMATEPLQYRLPEGAIDAILVTSAQATTALTPGDLTQLRNTPVYAVGAASASAARARGFVDVRIAAGDGDALLDLVRMTHAGAARLLYLAGRIRKPDLEMALIADGHRLWPIDTYDTCAVPWSDAIVEQLLRAPPEACLHFSRRSAELAIEASRPRLRQAFEQLRHVCLSEDVATPLRATASRSIVVAIRPDLESLLQSLVPTISAAS